jgi:hypothetical protein
MNAEIKRNIQLIVEKSGHSFAYLGNSMVIEGKQNALTIELIGPN